MAVPAIDLSGCDDAALAKGIDAALRDAGFFAITGMACPVPWSAPPSMRRSASSRSPKSTNNPARHAPLTAGEHQIEMYKRTTVTA